MASKKDKQGYLLIGLVAIAVLGFFAFKFSQDSKPKAGPDNCVGQVDASTVLLLDHSEMVSAQTQDEIVARAMRFVREKVGLNERVSVFSVDDISRQSLKPLVSLCRPPEDGNRLVENTKLIQRRFFENFEKPIRAALRQSSGNGNESPIAQAITDVSLSQYLSGRRTQLLVFSDLLEHTSAFSLYKCGASSEVVRRYRESRQGAQERPVFRNAHIELHIIPRANQSAETLKCRDKLWPWFFGDNGGDAAELSITYLPGGSAEKLNPTGSRP